MQQAHLTGLPIFAGKLKGVGSVGQLPAPKPPSYIMASAKNYSRSGYIAAKVGGSDAL